MRVYVDGSFNSSKRTCGYGIVFVDKDNNVKKEMSGKLTDDIYISFHQVSGELIAVVEAMSYCQDNGITDVVIHYDYLGIENWPSGKWKANKKLTQQI